MTLTDPVTTAVEGTVETVEKTTVPSAETVPAPADLLNDPVGAYPASTTEEESERIIMNDYYEVLLDKSDYEKVNDRLLNVGFDAQYHRFVYVDGDRSIRYLTEIGITGKITFKNGNDLDLRKVNLIIK